MSDPALEPGRKLFAGSCDFVAGADSLAILPPVSHPEIAFIGRSNVGKSSLINALTGRKALARVSVTPGRTQQLNFFLLSDTLMLVDLPGYGYAKAAKDKISDWNELIRNYLRGRPNLHRVCLLIDTRRGVMDVDREMMSLLDESAVSYVTVLTKQDKLSDKEKTAAYDAAMKEIKTHPAAYPDVFATSSHAAEGIAELRARLAEWCRERT